MSLENFILKSKKDKIIALEMEIAQQMHYLEMTSQPYKARNRVKYIRSLEKELKKLKTS